MQVRCLNCQAETQSDAQFCRNCGWQHSASLFGSSVTEQTTRQLPNMPVSPDAHQTNRLGGRPTAGSAAPMAGVIPPMPSPRSRNPFLILIAAGIPLLAILAIVFFSVVAIKRGVHNLRPTHSRDFVGSVASSQFVQTYLLAPDGQVTLKAISGSIEIVPSDDGKIELTATREGGGAPIENLLAISSSERSLTIGPGRGAGSAISLKLKIPRKLGGLELTTVSGDIEVTGIEGTIHAQSASGDISLSEVTGPISVHTASGEQTVKFASSPKGDVDLLTASGDLRLQFPGIPDLVAELSTTSGDISTDYSLPINERPGSKSASGQIGKGGPKIKARTASGDISLGPLE